MGLLRKAVRRATPRPVRKAKRVVRHPARTAVRAATPRPIRNAQRTVFNVAHPVNAAENALINRVAAGSRAPSRRRSAGSSRSPGAAYRGGSHAGGYSAASAERAQIGVSIEQIETEVFSTHLLPVRASQRPVAPALTDVDPQAEREQAEHDSGAAALAAKLAPFGSPPVARDPDPVDEKAIRHELFEQDSADVSRWKLGTRRKLRAQTRDRAIEDAKVETERRAGECLRQQEQLDEEWERLAYLREISESKVQRWKDEETARRQVARDRTQADLDEQWRRLRDNDPDAVTVALREAFDDSEAAIVGVTDATAVVAVLISRLDDTIADREAAYTPSGRPTLHRRTKTRMNDLYVAAVASRCLFAANAALDAGPGLEAVRCVALRPAETSGAEAIYAGTISKSLLEELREHHWTADPDVLAQIPPMADDVHINRRGRAHELRALAFDEDPSVKGATQLFDGYRPHSHKKPGPGAPGQRGPRQQIADAFA